MIRAVCGLAGMTNRPLLTAEWRNLVLLNFPIPTEIIKRLAPPGTEPDLHNGQSYISIVGFCFENVRLFGIPFPGHTSFPEINLRYYVRRTVGTEVRRGVAFAREIVPRRAVSIVANCVYNENYITRPMRSEIEIAGAELAPGDTIAYSWKSTPHRLLKSPELVEGRSVLSLSKGRFSKSAAPPSRLAARVSAPLALPTSGSLEEFIVEHYWGYTHGRDSQTREYQVAHIPWRTAPADNITWDCDVAANYNAPLAEFLTAPPASAIIAAGSPVQVFRGQCL
jgi:uncharacterized protein YqjF (DUF2071 family)